MHARNSFFQSDRDLTIPFLSQRYSGSAGWNVYRVLLPSQRSNKAVRPLCSLLLRHYHYPLDSNGHFACFQVPFPLLSVGIYGLFIGISLFRSATNESQRCCSAIPDRKPCNLVLIRLRHSYTVLQQTDMHPIVC